MRTIWTWMAIGGAALAAYLAKTVFNFSETQIAIAFGIVALMALGYQVNSLREERPQLKKKFVKNLLYSDPITVKHNPPKTLTPDGKQCWGAEEHDFEWFKLFWYFGEAVNGDLGDSPFRIQEINSTEMSYHLAFDSPAYGRRYEIFYNQVNVGLLEIMASRHQRFDEQDKSVRAHIALNRAPVMALSHQSLYGFLATIAGLVTSTVRRPYEGGKTEYEEAQSRLNHQMSEVMWNTLHDYTLGEPPMANDLEVQLSGTPDDYNRIEAHERAERMRARAEQPSVRSA